MVAYSFKARFVPKIKQGSRPARCECLAARAVPPGPSRIGTLSRRADDLLTALCANNDETKTCREFTVEGIG
jgi:hypothetical protein